MALITLEEAKTYLRVDSADEEALIESLLLSALRLCADIGRLTDEEYAQVDADPGEDDGISLLSLRATMKVAALYALGYLFEHRDEADHHDLAMTLRSLLFAVREGRP